MPDIHPAQNVIDFIVETVRDSDKLDEFVNHPRRVLKKFNLTRTERRLLRRGLFRKDVCQYILDAGRGGNTIVQPEDVT